MSFSAEAVVLSTRLVVGGVAPIAGLRRLAASGFSIAVSSGLSRDNLLEALRGLGSDVARRPAAGTGLSSSSNSSSSSSEAAEATDGIAATSLPSRAGSSFFLAVRLGATTPASVAGSDQ